MNRSYSRLMSRFCFTLIELLVAVAVVAILAAILFPVLALARTKTRQTPCLVNMKAIGLALNTYAQDYDEMWPRMDTCAAPHPGPTNPNAVGCSGPTYGQRVNVYKWPAFVLPYMQSVDLFFCPQRRATEINNAHWTNDGEIYNGYALNTAITGTVTARIYRNDSFLGKGSLAALQTPGQTMLVMESAVPGVPPYYPKSVPNPQHTSAGEQIETIYPIAYREVWNYAPADDHQRTGEYKFRAA